MSLREFSDRFPSLCARLLRTKATGRVGHAYLFVGDAPDFLRRFVRTWAQVCACLTPTDEGDACGTCEPCLRFADDSYSELYRVSPQSKSRQILVDNIRGLEHQLGLATASSIMKIGIVEEADCMGDQAQNAFLKTLEEPARNSLLLLYTSNPRGLLPTIRSRCQVISLLQNRRDYTNVLDSGLFAALARVRRNAGAAAGLAAAARLSAILGDLQARAEETVGEETDERWDAVAADDKALSKRLEEDRRARVQAEYLRLRNDVTDAIHAWFLQQTLLSAGVPREELPHPEFLAAADDNGEQPPPWREAEENARLAVEMARALSANVNERLAVEAFCLTACSRHS